MLALVFLALFVVSLGLWAAGAPVWLVALVAFTTWIAFYFLLYPKVRTYKAAMGIDDKLDSWETTGFEWLKLRLAGFKVLALGFATSMLPFLGDAAQWLAGQNLDFVLDPTRPERKQMVTFVIGAIVFAVPFLTSWLHSSTAAKAAETVPNG